MSHSDPITYRAHAAPEGSRLRVLAVAGAKGGSGKTNVAVNLAIAAAETGRRVLLIDGDAALANADVLLDLAPRHHLGDVLSGARPIEEALVESPHGVTLLPAASGELGLERLDDAGKLALLGALESLGDAYDAVVIDTPSGLSPNARFFAGAAEDVVLVTTPEPTALVDTYAGLEALARDHGTTRAQLVVNQAADAATAIAVCERLAHLARRFLGLDVQLAGWLPFDVRVHRAVMRQVPVLVDAPDAPYSRHLRGVAEHLLGQGAPDGADRLRFFWRQLFASPSAALRTAPERSLLS
ncbi:MAG: MinD/ParA family protein [Deltaproteobacteria bacterium]|nr:MAG: MinD/ParA family protein [Deltaproteobacteria bacterium]